MKFETYEEFESMMVSMRDEASNPEEFVAGAAAIAHENEQHLDKFMAAHLDIAKEIITTVTRSQQQA